MRAQAAPLAVLVAASLAAAPSGARAGQPEADAARLGACLDAGSGLDACLGAVLRPCIAASTATEAAAIACHRREELAWTALHGAAAARLSAKDRALEPVDPAFVRDSEREAAAARRARCAVFGARVGAVAEASCRRAAAARRAAAMWMLSGF